MSLYDKVVLKGQRGERYSFKDTLNDSLDFLYKTYGIRLLFIAVLLAAVGEILDVAYFGYDRWLYGVKEDAFSNNSIIDYMIIFIPAILSTMFLVDFFKRLRKESFRVKSIIIDGFKGFLRLLGSIMLFIFFGSLFSFSLSFLFMLLPFTILLFLPLILMYVFVATAINYALVDEVGIPFFFSIKRGYNTVIKNGNFIVRLLLVFAIHFIIAWTFRNVSTILTSDIALIINKIISSIVMSFVSLNVSAFIALSFIYYAEPIWPERYKNDNLNELVNTKN